MPARLVVVVEDGLVQDLYADAELGIDVLVVDRDAKQFADDADDRVSIVGEKPAWVVGHQTILDVSFVTEVFEAWR